MNKTKSRAWLLLPFFLCWGGSLTFFRPACEEVSRFESQENFLREARVVAIDKDGPGGRTSLWLVTLDDGKSQGRALFRHVDRPRPHPAPDSYKYDLAAYGLAKLLRVEIVPPVIEKVIEGRKGSLQVYLENCIRERDRRRQKLEPPDPKAFAFAREGIRVFENLVYDECQDFDDLLIHREDWRVCRVDFSEAFSPSPELLSGCEITVCPRALYEGLCRLEEKTVKSALRAYLNKEEIGALIIRKGRLVEIIKKRIKDKGEEAVLF
ncbi:MAG: hypothetical protein AB1715_02170 [Acidobacteriota bacterium]